MITSPVVLCLIIVPFIVFTNPPEWLIIYTLVVFGVIYVINRIHDSRVWNNGICEDSGFRWKQFDSDFQGRRGYTDGQGHYCWMGGLREFD